MKNNRKLIIEILIGLLLGGFLIYYGLTHTKTRIQRVNELINKGYNQHQIDSIIKKEDDELTTAYMNLAG